MDEAVLRQVRQQAGKVKIESFVAAVLLTGLSLMIPNRRFKRRV